jgi:hypothetical protein
MPRIFCGVILRPVDYRSGQVPAAVEETHSIAAVQIRIVVEDEAGFLDACDRTYGFADRFGRVDR